MSTTPHPHHKRIEKTCHPQCKQLLKITGDKISLEERPAGRPTTASARCALIGRPGSAIPLRSAEREPHAPRRPFSAGASYPPLMPSSLLLESLLTDPWSPPPSPSSPRRSATPGASGPPSPEVGTQTSIDSAINSLSVEEAATQYGAEDGPQLADMDIERLFEEPNGKKVACCLRQKCVRKCVNFVSSPIRCAKDCRPEKVENVQTWMGEQKVEVMEAKSTLLDLLADVGEQGEKVEQVEEQLEPPQHDTEEANPNCDEISGVFFTLKEADEKSQGTIECTKQISRESTPSAKVSELLSYLDQVDLSCTVPSGNNSLTQIDTFPKLETLLTYSQEELARHVIDQNLCIKEKSSSITFLQNELSQLRTQCIEQSKKIDQTIKMKLNAQKSEYEATVQRHQKFIDQLINDKKSITQQCEQLLVDMKSMEERFQSNLKAQEHRHQVDLQKTKEMAIAGEKMRRERWIDTKTQKIKELTVKSIEPEIQSMEKRQQQELTDARSFHRREIEDLELKAARKMQEQCEALRNQMVEDREKAVAHERDTLRVRYEKMVELEERTLREQRRKLQIEHANRLEECELKENMAMVEKEKGIRQAQQDFEERLQIVIRRHANELKLMRETTALEMEAWMGKVEKQQAIELLEKERGIREMCRRERDQEIENVIERLENEESENRRQFEATYEKKERRLKVKFEKEIEDLEMSERQVKEKYKDLRKAHSEALEEVMELKNHLKGVENQLEAVKRTNRNYMEEKEHLREVLRNELRREKEDLEKELTAIKQTRDQEVEQLYERVKVSVARKDEVIAEMTQDSKSLQEKCCYLECMLEQQRKDYYTK